METKKKRLWEVIVLVVVMAVGVALAAYVFTERGKVDKEREMIGELGALRAGVTLYSTVNRVPPKSLNALTSKTYEAGDGSRLPYVVGLSAERAADGKVLDPFGNAYAYDAKRAWVYSSTKGYRDW